MFSTLKKAGLAVALTAATASTAVPASAAADPIQITASSRCLVGWSGDCTTAVVGAHPSGHWIDYWINNVGRPSRCPFRVRDVNTRAVVRSGTVGVSGLTAGRVPGLYGYYQLELRGCSVSAEGLLDND
ncbi:hypothetical protein ACFOWZ_15605 [Lentzea rhizosphaerae]|jgi:hypothetical protein|uniref:Uncharacterized protein n=1 Tax=Lentzea rhizosphaerae TaxID=2041025 RepID=A0ABV8BVB6_9PSEU